MSAAKPLKENSGSDQFFLKVTDSIQLMVDLTSRIDERVKILSENQNDLESKNEKIIESFHNLQNRLTIIETKEFPSIINSLENKNKDLEHKVKDLENKIEKILHKQGTSESRVSFVFDAIWKMVLMCITGYILFKLGIQAPPN